MANPSKKAAPSYFAIKASIMALSIACTLGGWGYLAKQQFDDAKMKQAEAVLNNDISIASDQVPIAPVALRKVVDIARPEVKVVQVSAKTVSQPPVKNTTALRKVNVKPTSAAAQPASQNVAVSPAVAEPVRRKPVARTRSSR